MRTECRRALENLDRELEGAEALWQAGHIAECEACRSEAAAREALRERLRRAVKAVPVDGALAGRVREATVAPGPRYRWQAWAAAAALLVAVGGYWALPWVESGLGERAYFAELPARVSRMMRVGLSDHVHCAAFRKFREPVREELPAGFRPVLAHIPEGYRVVAAHECKARGRNFVHVVMQGASGRVASLVIARKEGGETFANSSLRRVAGEMPVFTEEVPRFQIAGFEAGGFLAFVVSDLSGEENQRLALVMAGPVRALLAAMG